MAQTKKPVKAKTNEAPRPTKAAKPAAPANTGWGGSQPVLTLKSGKPINPWLVLLSIIFGFFMSLLDATITNIALTNIQSNLQTDLTTVTWIINAYSIAFAALLVTMGRFADQFGRKRVFMTGMVIFSLGSLACAMAPSIEFLIAFRVIQGIGAAALNSVSLAIITGVFPPNKRGAAIGIWGALAGLAAAVGPVLGGLLLAIPDWKISSDFIIASWRWIFFVNIPFCIIGLFMISRNVPEMRDQNAKRNLDILGLVTLTAGMVLLSYGFIQSNEWKWNGGIIALLAGGVVALILFFVVEIKQANPIMDFRLFRIRSFSAANIVMFMFSVAMQGAFLIFILYFTEAKGDSALDAAYAIIPLPLASFVISAAASRFSHKANPKYLAIAGMVIIGAGFLALYTLSYDATYLDTAWRGIIIGVGMALCFASLPNMTLSEVPRERLGVASGAFNTSRQFGFVLGVAILISIFSGQVSNNMNTAIDNSVNDVKASGLPTQVQQPIITGLEKEKQAMANTSMEQGSTSSTDYTKYANSIPDPTLKKKFLDTTSQIGGEFNKAFVDAFRVDWFAAAIFALFGIIPALFTSAPKHNSHAPQDKEAQEAAAAAAGV